MKTKVNPLIIITGLVIGIAAVFLALQGNPKNMGFCIACFIRDIAGTTKLHTADQVQYFRPEILGIVLGALIMALVSGEWRAKAGSSPVLRFVLGAMVMIGALIFLGCPLRMVIRMGGGDLNAYVGLLGFVVGILIGVVFLKKGFGLKRNYDTAGLDGFVLPIVLILIFVAFYLAWPVFTKALDAAKAGVQTAGLDEKAAKEAIAAAAKPIRTSNGTLFNFSVEGPGSMHAPIIIALIAGLIVGALAQKSRMCMVGGVRDIVLFKNFNLIIGFVAVFVAVLVGNLILGGQGNVVKLNFGTTGQPIAHNDGLWNFLGMVIVGWGSCLLGGCPLRQLILTGEGNGDSAITVLGMLVGAAFAHNFKTAASGTGIGQNSSTVAIGCLIALLVISLTNLKSEE